MRTNEGLKELYEKAYSGGKAYHGDKDSFFTFPTTDVTNYVVSHVDFKGKTVLEVGCGTGETAVAMAKGGAKSVLAIDYAEEAIKTCRNKHIEPNLEYRAAKHEDITGQFDIVLLQEVIEHLDDTEGSIRALLSKVKPDGKLVLTCPNFSNLRGYIWMTLQLLFDVPMSLSDIHFFTPVDFQDLAKRMDLNLAWSTFAQDRVHGEKLLIDFKKRLTNALRDAKMDNSNVDVLLDWLKKVSRIDNKVTDINGGIGFYVLSRKMK